MNYFTTYIGQARTCSAKFSNCFQDPAQIPHDHVKESTERWSAGIPHLAVYFFLSILLRERGLRLLVHKSTCVDLYLDTVDNGSAIDRGPITQASTCKAYRKHFRVLAMLHAKFPRRFPFFVNIGFRIRYSRPPVK